ncbi:MAG: hypothetical protein AB8B72_13350 [Crocinitomicaceae bacterium]
MKAFALYPISILFLVSCINKPEAKVVAEVYENQLLETDIINYIENQKIQTDSASMVEMFINTWITNQVLMQNAISANIPEKSKINKKVEDYKTQLLVHYYQNKLIKEKLDTSISKTEIEEYYLSHQPDFQLKDYLVKVLYIKVADDAPELEKLSSLYKIRNQDDEKKIIQYAGLYASNFYLDKDNWIYFDEILKEIPLGNINKDRFITQKSKTKFKENNFHYYLNILDYKLKNAVSPLEFERNNIKERILNKRILTLRESISEQLIQKAENENAIKKY